MDLTRLVQEQDAGVHHEILGSGSLVKLHKFRETEEESAILSYSTPIFIIIQKVEEGLKMLKMTYNEEIVETLNLDLELTQLLVSCVIDFLNQPYRMCTGLDEDKVAEQSLQKLLVERVRAKIVYRSRDCTRVIKEKVKQEDESSGLHELCSSCQEIVMLDIKTENALDIHCDDIVNHSLSPDIPNFVDVGRSVEESFEQPIKSEEPKIRVKKVKRDGLSAVSIDKLMFACTVEECDRRFRHERARDKHSLVSHEATTRCPSQGCSRKFKKSQKRRLLTHISKFHAEEPACLYILSHEVDINCKTCEKPVGRFAELVEHEKTCAHQEVTCELCGQVYASVYSLKTHMAHVHSDEGFICEEPGCGKKIKSKDSLRDHINSVHKNQKMHVCSGCGKEHRYRQRRLLCEKKHEGTFLHPCSICDKKFNDRRRFSQHMRTHTGEKPFVCPVCNFRCARKDNLNLHTKKVHGLTRQEAESITGKSILYSQISLTTEEKGDLASL